MKQPIVSAHAGPEESPGFVLWQVTALWQARQRAALAPLGLTHPQFVLLAIASWLESTEEDPPTQSRLAFQARIDPMMTSQLVRTLEAKKLLRRSADPEDARAWRITPTAAGRRLAQEGINVVEEVDREFFAPLTNQQRQLTRMLRTLVEESEETRVTHQRVQRKR